MATTESLEIHVFGGAKGESIVLRLPSGAWGVVDCYAPSTDPSRNPTLEYLRSRQVDRLEFVGLTHPHDDHYMGMSHLLDNFQVRYFWRPSAMTGSRLARIIKAAKVEAQKSGEHSLTSASDELERIFHKVREKRQTTSLPLIPRAAVAVTELYPVPFDSTADFRILAIAPSTGQVERHEDELGKCFDHESRSIEALAPVKHNRISLGLVVIFGKTRLILGGDVETDGWADALELFGADNLAATAVKISHHGSATGYVEGLWNAFARQASPVGLLTSYRSKRLPRREALQHIQKFAPRILTPSLSALHLSERIALSTTEPIESRRAVVRAFKARPRKFETGRCSLVFDNAGNCLREEFAGDAGDAGAIPSIIRH